MFLPHTYEPATGEYRPILDGVKSSRFYYTMGNAQRATDERYIDSTLAVVDSVLDRLESFFRQSCFHHVFVEHIFSEVFCDLFHNCCFLSAGKRPPAIPYVNYQNYMVICLAAVNRCKTEGADEIILTSAFAVPWFILYYDIRDLSIDICKKTNYILQNNYYIYACIFVYI